MAGDQRRESSGEHNKGHLEFDSMAKQKHYLNFNKAWQIKLR